MGKKNKPSSRLYEDIGEPPDQLENHQIIGSVIKPLGNSLYEVEIPTSHWTRAVEVSPGLKTAVENQTIIASMPPKFRNTIFVKRGGYVLIDLYTTEQGEESTNRAHGELSNIVTDKKGWQSNYYWPTEFKDPEKDEKIDLGIESSSDEEE